MSAGSGQNCLILNISLDSSVIAFKELCLMNEIYIERHAHPLTCM